MKQTTIWILAAANVALAATLAVRGIDQPAAQAQAAPRNAEPGKYTLIPGESQLGVAIVYVFDSTNRRLGAIAPDSQDRLAPMPTIALDPIFDSAVQERPANPTPGRPGRPR